MPIFIETYVQCKGYRMLHIVLGTIGAIGFATEAIIASTGKGHGGIGIGSAVAMGVGFAIVIW